MVSVSLLQLHCRLVKHTKSITTNRRQYKETPAFPFMERTRHGHYFRRGRWRVFHRLGWAARAFIASVSVCLTAKLPRLYVHLSASLAVCSGTLVFSIVCVCLLAIRTSVARRDEL